MYIITGVQRIIGQLVMLQTSVYSHRRIKNLYLTSRRHSKVGMEGTKNNTIILLIQMIFLENGLI